MKPEGIFYLVPCTLGTYPPAQVLPAAVLDIIRNLDCFIVENAKTARAFLKACEILKPQSELELFEIDKHNPAVDIDSFLKPLLAGKNMGLLSEAGVPAVADPGAFFVKKAHQLNIKVVPLTGPSSLLLALMASGLDGQRFCFHGYLPVDRSERARTLIRLEKEARQHSQTQLFIETPYRNNQMLKDICESLSPDVRLCIAVNLTTENESVVTRTVKEWKKQIPDLNKKPAVFLLGV